MKEYIDKQAAIIQLSHNKSRGDDEWMLAVESDMGVIRAIPAADVVPVVHGRWLPIVSYNNTYKCSECGRLLVDIADGLKMVAKHYPYCHCGAKMDGKMKE